MIVVSCLTGKTLVVTNQPYFYKKAELFPDSTFVVGVDTAIRLLDVSNSPRSLIIFNLYLFYIHVPSHSRKTSVQGLQLITRLHDKGHCIVYDIFHMCLSLEE